MPAAPDVKRVVVWSPQRLIGAVRTLAIGVVDGRDAGEAAMTATAMRLVNAVPFVVAAAPGLVSSLDRR
jgi:hypothetical protein